MTVVGPPRKKKQPPRAVDQSKQYDLFTSFFGDSSELSNTIELWDAIPKYAVSARRQSAMRDGQGRFPQRFYEWEFEYRGRRCRLEIQAASLKEKERYIEFYPSVDEELVEEVIRKLFANQSYGLHDADGAESWVRFSLQMIRKELKVRRKTRSLTEIKRSIEILANTTIRLYVDDDDTPIYTNAVLSDLTRINRRAYLDDTSAMWVARLPAMVSKSVNELSYRQFNYGTFMGLSSQLARWLHKRLSHQYVNAGFMHDYSVLLTTIGRDSGLLTANRVTKNRASLEGALHELIAKDVLLDWSSEERRGSHNRIDDVLYALKAHPEFIREVKAANARQRDSREALGLRMPQRGRRSRHQVIGARDKR